MSMSQIMDDVITGAQSENEQLLARIEELQKREAMLVAALKEAEKTLLVYSHQISHRKLWPMIAEALSKSADAEAWLQAEIMKRLGEPAWWVSNGKFYKVQQRDDCGMGDFYPNQIALYRLPSPATEERKG